MPLPRPLLLLFSFFFLTSSSTLLISTAATPPPPPLRLLKNPRLHLSNTTTPDDSPQHYFEVTQPLHNDKLTPSCSLPILQQDFGNTYGEPPVTVSYSPPFDCTWSRVTLEFSVSCYGEQYDRIAAIWLGGAEILRTSTSEPTESGIFWTVRKDVTKYSSLLVKEDLDFTVMLENIVNDIYTGVYQVNITILYYDTGAVTESSSLSRKLLGNNGDGDGFIAMNVESTDWFGSSSELYPEAADLIIPISTDGVEGYWSRIELKSDTYSKEIQIPKNTHRAVLEIYLSFHGNDEFWYKNFPDSYIINNSLTTQRGNGAYREVIVMIDGKFAGSFVPFPVIFTGGINPLFWEPVVGIGAFDLPSYEVDLTPFLALLLEGEEQHTISIGVTDALSYWLVDANLHLWLDPSGEDVKAGYKETRVPSYEIRRIAEFEGINGKFIVEMERVRLFSGWVQSSLGKVTTYVKHVLESENEIRVKKQGVHETIRQRVKDKMEVRHVYKSAGGLAAKSTLEREREYPLSITITTKQKGNDTYKMSTILVNSFIEETKGAGGSSILKNYQRANGWMFVNGNEVVDGKARTDQTYFYKDRSGRYRRVVAASNGEVLTDTGNFLS